MPYEVKLTIYIILAIIVFGLLSFWIIYPFVKNRLFSLRYKKMYYKYVNHIVNYNDYYLINSLSFDAGESLTLTIDHLIGGDKYIYVIIDYYIPGGIEINPKEQLSVIYKKNNEKLEMGNPLRVVSHAMSKLSMSSGIPNDFLVGIALFNDDANIISIENSSSEVNIVRLKDLSKFISHYEESPVKPFVKKQLWQAIHDLAAIKENVNAKRKERE